jgi:acyl-CoA hydrolase
MRHARTPCVTIAIDSMNFKQPVHVGQLMVCQARVTYVGRSSIEVQVLVHAENLLTREVTHTNSAYVVYVSLERSTLAARDGRRPQTVCGGHGAAASAHPKVS